MENLKVEDVLPIKEDYTGDYSKYGKYRINLAFPNMISKNVIPFKMTNHTEEEAHLARLGIFEIIKQWAKQLNSNALVMKTIYSDGTGTVNIQELPLKRNLKHINEKEWDSFIDKFNAHFDYGGMAQHREDVLQYIIEELFNNEK
jgi:hypothetical protein